MNKGGKAARNNDFIGVVYHYCQKPGHMKWYFKKLLGRNQRTQGGNRSGPSSDKMILVSAEEFDEFSQYQKLLKESSSINTLAEFAKFSQHQKSR